MFDLGLSDHNLIYTVMRLQCPKFSPRTVVKRQFKHYDPGGGEGGYSREFWIGVCREGSWTLTLFKD